SHRRAAPPRLPRGRPSACRADRSGAMLSTAAAQVLAQVQIRERTNESCIQKNKFCPGWIVVHFDRYTHPLVQHIVLTVVSVGAGFAIAFALALLTRRRRWAVGPILGFTGILYTLP